MNAALQKIISAPTLALIERVAEASGRSTIQYLGDFLGGRILDSPNLWAEHFCSPTTRLRAKAEHAAEVFSEQYSKFCRNLTFKTLVRSVSKRLWKVDGFYWEDRRWKRLVCYSNVSGLPTICIPEAYRYYHYRHHHHPYYRSHHWQNNG
jgi:hypothetical protein